MKRTPVCIVLAVTVLFSAPAAAAPLVIEAGQTYTLREDLVLKGDDVLEIRGTAEKPCTLVGNQHRITSGAKWSGVLQIAHCTLKQLGTTAAPGIEITTAGTGGVRIEHCTFDGCSAIHVQNDERSTATFRNNTVLDNTTVATHKDIAKSAHAFVARGNSRERKLFQGNFLPRGKAVFQAANWLIGGDTDADSNLFIGLRIGVDARGEGTVVRGNYFHLLMPITEEFPYWSQISVFTTGPGVVGEHNVIRDGEWIVRFVEGEFRYNVITDIIDHDLMQNGSNGRIHHNLFLAGTSKHRQGSMGGCIAVIYPPKEPGEGIEIFNNVFDGGDRLDVPAIEVSAKAFVKSLRNNVFCNFRHGEKYGKLPQAMVRANWHEAPGDEDKPARLGYADYNLFYNPAAKSQRNYLLAVAGKIERKDAGFGLNDIPRGGKVDEQADPKFKGPLPRAFPHADEEVKARKVTVSQILAFYRAAYSPAEGSPLIGAGDPADGPGSFIGAVGPGKNAPKDEFGRFGTPRP